MLLRYLGMQNSSEWVPPLLAFLVEQGQSADAVVAFLTRFDRLSFGMLLRGVTRDKRIVRYRQVIRDMRKAKGRIDAIGALDLSTDEQRNVLHRASGGLHRASAHLCKLVLLRLSGALDSGPIPTKLSDISVEHVLPLSPARDSAWLEAFPDSRERELCTRMLGNLILLTTKQNNAAKNSEFAIKRDIFFPDGTPSEFDLTNELWGVKAWTPASIRARNTALLMRLQQIWSLEGTVA
jgi:Protein of unknown function (DUF1524)